MAQQTWQMLLQTCSQIARTLSPELKCIRWRERLHACETCEYAGVEPHTGALQCDFHPCCPLQKTVMRQSESCPKQKWPVE